MLCSVQPRSVVAVGAVASNCVALHVVSAVHVRSVVLVGATLSYCTPAVHVVSGAHSRSLDALGAAVSYCKVFCAAVHFFRWHVAEHVLTALHVRSDVPDAGDDSY